ncbi:unnamed protein product [Ceratitis capitata]|uniref:(Mediterranean fruit fly) hypothetical protein n=1 Tax=Ceratitis capitata TaxID=7213 RepID=A0A811U3V0_CERCA|nr:unnamed protein product [Ceratitis capitata]
MMCEYQLRVKTIWETADEKICLNYLPSQILPPSDYQLFPLSSNALTEIRFVSLWDIGSCFHSLLAASYFGMESTNRQKDEKMSVLQRDNIFEFFERPENACSIVDAKVHFTLGTYLATLM